MLKNARITAFTVSELLRENQQEISSASFSCISDHMTHNTLIVYAFLNIVINDHIKARYPFLKSISYFSDGSTAPNIKTIRAS